MISGFAACINKWEKGRLLREGVREADAREVGPEDEFYEWEIESLWNDCFDPYIGFNG